MISPTQALALGHWNVNEISVPNGDLTEDGMDSSGTSDNTDEETEDPATKRRKIAQLLQTQAKTVLTTRMTKKIHLVQDMRHSRIVLQR
jgi:hypothetical protein